MAARSSLLRRPTPGARPARRASSGVAALAALAPRLVRLVHHDYPDGLLGRAHGPPHAALRCPLRARRPADRVRGLGDAALLPRSRGRAPRGARALRALRRE